MACAGGPRKRPERAYGCATVSASPSHGEVNLTTAGVTVVGEDTRCHDMKTRRAVRLSRRKRAREGRMTRSAAGVSAAGAVGV